MVYSTYLGRMCNNIFTIYFYKSNYIGSNTSLTKYPYFFLYVDKLGVSGVALWCVGLVVFFSLLAYLNYLYDRLYIQKKSNKQN